MKHEKVKGVIQSVKSLTTVLARTFIFGIGMKLVMSRSATVPIGKTECGS